MPESGPTDHHVRLRTFGGLALLDESGNRISDAENLRRPLLILVLLALAGPAGMSRDKLCAFLAPESDSNRSRNILKQSVFRLRRAVNRSDVVFGTTDLRLNPDAVSTDAGDFLEAVRVGDLKRTLKLYLGPFLDGVYFKDAPEFGEWAESERARFARLAERALHELASKAEAEGDFGEAAELWRRLAELQPADRQAALGLIRTLAAAGERHRAIGHARTYIAYLRSQLDAEPDAEFLGVVEQIRMADSRPKASSPSPTKPPGSERPAEVRRAESPPAIPALTRNQPANARSLKRRFVRTLGLVAVVVVVAIIVGLRTRHVSGMNVSASRRLDTFRTLSAQGDATCASGKSGIFCWGRNDEGQVGDGSTQDALAATAIAKPTDSVSHQLVNVSMGYSHACALTSSRKTYCWGQNNEGELGLSAITGSAAPLPTANDFAFTQIASGAYHTCGISTASLLYCWGWNNYGQLGNRNVAGRSDEPVKVESDLSFSSVSSNYLHNCALTTDGMAYCWGSNVEGQIGTGENVKSQPVPALVTDAYAFAQIVAGSNHTCALAVTGEALCWGYNAFGQLGAFTSSRCGRAPYQVSCSPRPIPVHTNLRFSTLTAGKFHSCGLVVTGEAYCWGKNDQGQLGEGSLSDRFEPFPVLGGLRFTAIAGGANHTCAISIGSHVYCWGGNDHGQLGDGSRRNSAAPVEVSFSDKSVGSNRF
jgi:alpha-tubulin suppressor-like RCC1 family protein/DNA-binding SARP family transcriptional activator